MIVVISKELFFPYLKFLLFLCRILQFTIAFVVFALLPLAKSGLCGQAYSINFAHFYDLLCSFHIFLVDEDCIVPMERNQQVTTPSKSSGLPRPLLR
jgi:hypothetical protein